MTLRQTEINRTSDKNPKNSVNAKNKPQRDTETQTVVKNRPIYTHTQGNQDIGHRRVMGHR